MQGKAKIRLCAHLCALRARYGHGFLIALTRQCRQGFPVCPHRLPCYQIGRPALDSHIAGRRLHVVNDAGLALARYQHAIAHPQRRA